VACPSAIKAKQKGTALAGEVATGLSASLPQHLPQMNLKRFNWNLTLPCTAVGALITGLAMKPSIAQVAPGLTISQLTTNQLQIVITNGSSLVNYEIYRTPLLDDPFYPWTLHLIGMQGQTNFTIDMGIETFGFFEAGVGSDWDQDGIPNYLDAQPSSTNAGILTITIESPLNGANVQ